MDAGVTLSPPFASSVTVMISRHCAYRVWLVSESRADTGSPERRPTPR
jgi:hypothetical protein